MAQVSISRGGVPNHAIEQGDVSLGGIAGDGWRHPQFHGIAKRAILLVTLEGIEEVQAKGFPIYPGALGENITTLGLDRRALRVGYCFRCGTATIQITEVRLPCNTLNVYGSSIQEAIYDVRVMEGDPSSEVWGLSGFYGAVIQAGMVRPGDSILLVE